MGKLPGREATVREHGPPSCVPYCLGMITLATKGVSRTIHPDQHYVHVLHGLVFMDLHSSWRLLSLSMRSGSPDDEGLQ